jgi:hypothetical protein
MKILLHRLLQKLKSLFKKEQKVRTYLNPIEIEASKQWEAHCLFDLNPTLIRIINQQPNDQELGAYLRGRYNMYQKDSYTTNQKLNVDTLK